MKVDLSSIERAHYVLKEVLEPTPLVFNKWLSAKYNCEVYLKLENMQPIGSFKIRGAVNRISKLTLKEKKKGVVASSAGNHAQGVAWAAAHFKTKATIVMPKNAPLTKMQNTKALGAKVILCGESYEEAFAEASRISRTTGAIFVHAFEDESVIAGQGTLGIEIVDQLPDADILIGAVGGGGLMAGVGIAVKALKPEIRIIAAQASGASSMVDSLNKKHVVQTGKAETFADGIKVKIASAIMFKLLRGIVDEAVKVDDEKIAEAVLNLIEKAHTVAEGAGALPLAVLDEIYKKNPKKIKGKKVVLIICGGNIDVNLIDRIIERGLLKSGRRLWMNVFLPDKPGSLSELTRRVAEQGANILQAIHNRDAASVKLNETSVEMTIETRGQEHTEQILTELRKHYDRIEIFH